MSTEMSTFYAEAVTLDEMGGAVARSVPGKWESRGDAFSAAIDYANGIAGPEREDYRRPTVAIVTDELLGMCVKVGDADVDASYTLVYIWSIAPAERPVSSGRGYVASKI